MTPTAAANPERARHADLVLAAGLVGLLLVLLVPLPAVLLDLLLVVNLSGSILILLLVISNERPLELSTFPTLLLFASLLRLALNVASTRLILLDGAAGQVIQSFGEFVVGGEVIVGVVIFLILVVIQFVVITKGAGRISEVAARFVLDSMPGKQMAIDADLNQGLMTPEEAVVQRKELSREMEFYGAMDGASKFVRGDAIAGLIITGVNILGGAGIAFAEGLGLVAALETYTILTIGDGLVSQIPALIVATSGAILVTKAGTQVDLGSDLRNQLTERRRGLMTAAGIVAAIGLMPGLPAFPFLALGGVLLLVARRGRAGSAQEAAPTTEARKPEEVAQAQSDELRRLLKVDRLGVELGYRLLHLVERSKDGSLLEHISQIRKRFATELGLIVPPVRVTDNVRLAPAGYRVMVHGQSVANGELRPGMLLAMDPGGAKKKLDGEKTREPTFGLPAVWIREEQRSEAELKGYTVVEPVSVLVTHLSEVLRDHASDVITRDDVKTLVEHVRAEQPALVEDLIPDPLGYGELHQVLRALLTERVSVRNMTAILEVLSENVNSTKDPEMLAELVRRRLARALVEPYLDESGRLQVVTLDPQVERSLAEIAKNQELPEGPGVVRAVLERLLGELRTIMERGQEGVVLVRAEVRTFLRDLLRSNAPRTVVLSYAEAAAANVVEPIAVIGAAETAGKE